MALGEWQPPSAMLHYHLMTIQDTTSPMALSPQAPVTRDAIRTRQVGWPIIVSVVALTVTILTGFLLLRRAGPLATYILPPWLENLFTFATLLLIVGGGVLLSLGRMRPSHLGLRPSKLAQAAVVLGVVWITGQLIGVGESLATTGSVALHRTWTTPGIGPTLVWAAVMLLGAALFEEIVYRGFLFPQLALKFRGSQRSRMWRAVVVSQAVFAAAHLPGHIVLRKLSGAPLLTQLGLQMTAGIVLLLLYLRTRNLWLSIGFHGMVNGPVLVVAAAWPAEMFIPVLLIAWPWLMRRPKDRGLASVEDVTSGRD